MIVQGSAIDAELSGVVFSIPTAFTCGKLSVHITRLTFIRTLVAIRSHSGRDSATPAPSISSRDSFLLRQFNNLFQANELCKCYGWRGESKALERRVFFQAVIRIFSQSETIQTLRTPAGS